MPEDPTTSADGVDFGPGGAEPDWDAQPARSGYGEPLGQYAGAGAGQCHAPVVHNYLVWSILATLFCCLPLGVVALINAAKVDSLAAAGDVNAARVASAQAKKFATWAGIVGGGLLALWVAFNVMALVLVGSGPPR